ncbi:8-amino-7-oxononanoate synthase [Halomonas sp. PR-M31]|uniref:8-amino-7-oxononanoate synthase n=1 Tax=Halomonas sp. PR-M31 TaxID=1471202 RepID=UPI00209EE687|nr:8-amino-7-oxononanoate synthase [Halomonas sp. PR-M31]
MSGSWPQRLAAHQSQRREQGLWRERRVHVRDAVDDFAGNDYLGLAQDPRVSQAAAEGAQRYGAGARASQLVSGHLEVHRRLEARLAALVGRPRALLFSSGYMANLGVLQALCDGTTAVFQDRLNHASLLDGAKLAGARARRFHHGDLDDLACLLRRSTSEAPRLVVSDGVFSMDGDVADVPGLVGLCRRHDAWLMIDDAHGLGVLGAHGDGCVGRAHGSDEVPVLVGTLGKALGTAGAFVAGSELLIEHLLQFARPCIYTTAEPPGVSAATLAALDILEQEPERREQLRAHIARFRTGAEALGLKLLPSTMPIQPLLLGDNARTLRWAETLRALGLLVGAIRAPTVPRGQARLRITLSATHETAQIERLLDALAELTIKEGRP